MYLCPSVGRGVTKNGAIKKKQVERKKEGKTIKMDQNGKQKWNEKQAKTNRTLKKPAPLLDLRPFLIPTLSGW